MPDDQPIEVAPARSDYTVKKGEVSLAVYRKRLEPQPGEAARPVLFLVHGSSNSGWLVAQTQMRAAGLPGRVFPAVGNHEVWDDSDVEGLLSAFPYLKQFGVTDKRLIYKFDYNDARFIFLWTGKYDYRWPSA